MRVNLIVATLAALVVLSVEACTRAAPADLASHADGVAARAPDRLPRAPTRPQLMFVSVAADDSHRHVTLAPLDRPEDGLFVTPLVCDRSYFAGPNGICLTSESSGIDSVHFADVFNDRFERTHRVKLTGPPSRVRISPDGRRAGATVFESGHSYAMEGFSTRTTIIDLTSGKTVGDLEDFAVWRGADRIRSVDFNFWGLTFERDGNGFYATLDTRGVQYLVRGDIDRREVRIVRSDVECPSLSPDNRQLVFKRLIGARSRGWWQLARLDLTTNVETVLTSETRSVDDQVEWLDDGAVLYHVTGSGTAADLWVLSVDGKSPPRRLLGNAYSPTVVR